MNSSGIRVVIGFIVALIIGGGGGGALHALAARDRAQGSAANTVPARGERARVTIESVKGVCRVLTPSGQWRVAREGESLERPTGLRTEGPESSMTVFHAGVRVVAQRDARMIIGQSASATVIDLDSGEAVVHSTVGHVKVMVPGAPATITGDAFGVWAKRDQTMIAVLDGEIAIDAPDGATKFAAGREVVLNAQGATPSVLAPQLKIEAQGFDRGMGRFMMRGKTSPNAVVMVRRGSHYEEVPVGSYGNFTTQIEGPKPAEGEVISYDAAGRRAQLDHPSDTLDKVLATISKGAPVAIGNAQQAGETAKAEPKTAPKAEAKAEPKTEPKAEAKAEPKAEAKAEPKKEVPAKKEPEKQPEAKKVEPKKAEPTAEQSKKEALAERADKKKKGGKKAAGSEVRGDNVPKPISIDFGGGGGGASGGGGGEEAKEKPAAEPKEKPAKKPAKEKGEDEGEEKGVELEWGQ